MRAETGLRGFLRRRKDESVSRPRDGCAPAGTLEDRPRHARGRDEMEAKPGLPRHNTPVLAKGLAVTFLAPVTQGALKPRPLHLKPGFGG